MRLPLCLPLRSVMQKDAPHFDILASAPEAVCQLPRIACALAGAPAVKMIVATVITDDNFRMCENNRLVRVIGFYLSENRLREMRVHVWLRQNILPITQPLTWTVLPDSLAYPLNVQFQPGCRTVPV